MFKSGVLQTYFGMFAACLTLGCLLSVGAVASGTANIIPSGYKSSVVLHVNYGNTLDKCPVNWGNSGFSGEGEFSAPFSMFGLKVLGDRFYFLADGVKMYRSPNKFVWAVTDMPNAQYFAVSPDGTVYVVWGCAMDSLSCISPKGKLLWTVSIGDLLPLSRRRNIEKQFGVSSIDTGLHQLSWTDQGLAVHLWVHAIHHEDDAGVIIFIDKNGKFSRAVSGNGVTKNGKPFHYRSVSAGKTSSKVTSLKINNKAASSNTTRITVSIAASSRIRTKDEMSIIGLGSSSCAGLVAHGHGILTKKIRLNKKDVSELDAAVWIFDDTGKLKEEWRFPQSCFEHIFEPSFDIDREGNFYHVEYGVTGLNVIKYSRK